MKTAGKDILGPVYLDSHVSRGYSRNLADGFGIHILEIQQHYLAIHGSQLMNQLQQPFKSHAVFGVALMIGGIGCGLDFFECGKSMEIQPALADDVSGRRVVRDAIDPRPQRTSILETFKASPHGKMNFLG